jgi:hypothetical protein
MENMSSLLDEFFSWLRVHSSGYRMRHDAMGWEIDYGYIKACDVIKAELERLIEEHKDDSDRVTGDKELLDEEVPECVDNTLSQS